MKQRTAFTMVEMMCALALTALLLVMFFSLQQQIRRSRAAFETEGSAILVLENTLERLRASGHPDQADAARIFAEEFASAGLPAPLTAATAATADGLRLGVKKTADGPWIAEVTLPCRK